MTTQVVNLRHDCYDIYIGRKSDSKFHFGNPFSHLSKSLAGVKVNSIQEAVDAYRNWLLGIQYQEIEPERRLWILENLFTLENAILGCFCRPSLLCHGDVLVELLEPKPIWYLDCFDSFKNEFPVNLFGSHTLQEILKIKMKILENPNSGISHFNVTTITKGCSPIQDK